MNIDIEALHKDVLVFKKHMDAFPAAFLARNLNSNINVNTSCNIPPVRLVHLTAQHSCKTGWRLL